MEDGLRREFAKQAFSADLLDMERLMNAAETQTDYKVILALVSCLIDGPYNLGSAVEDFGDIVAEPDEIFHLGIC